MTDRELLELAAKAAGIEHPGGEHCVNGPALWDCKALQWWKPLNDDGDALRLAVALGIEIHPNRLVSEIETAFCVHRPHLVGLNMWEEFGDDEMAATRRAIVRSAAEIGAHPKQHNDGGGHAV